MMVDLYQSFARPLSHAKLYQWHKLLMSGPRGLNKIGAYRTHREPMQIVSGAVHKPKVHFEAPPSNLVRSEMNDFVGWFNNSAPNKADPLSALTRAGIAHLYFECIHPFEDGNGRIRTADPLGSRPCH